LARPPGLPALIDCLFCGTVNSLSVSSQVKSQEATSAEVVRASQKAFLEHLKAALERGEKPYEALRMASAAHLGIAGQSEVVATISIALARDFEQETQTDAVDDPYVLARIAEGYLKALAELRTSSAAELNLPFLAANASGPKHLRRTVTAALFAELARRDPYAATAPPAPNPAPTAPPAPDPAPTATSAAATASESQPKKKRRWWPF
jgi:hypothetical protein